MKNNKKYQSVSKNIYKYLLVSFFLVIFFVVAPTAAFATDRYWYPDTTSGTGTGNWSDYVIYYG